MIPYIMVEPKQWSEMIQAMEENARHKAEVERLRNLGIKLDGYVDLLQGENERLRKAGDEVIHEWSSGDEKEARNFMKALVIWNAAKEVGISIFSTPFSPSDVDILERRARGNGPRQCALRQAQSGLFVQHGHVAGPPSGW